MSLILQQLTPKASLPKIHGLSQELRNMNSILLEDILGVLNFLAGSLICHVLFFQYVHF